MIWVLIITCKVLHEEKRQRHRSCVQSSNQQPTISLADISKQGFKIHCAYVRFSKPGKICTLQSPFLNMRISWFIHFVSAKQNSKTKIWKQLLWALNSQWRRPKAEERMLEVRPRLPRGLDEILYTKAPSKAPGSQQTLDQ